jgi:hypothetical protein
MVDHPGREVRIDLLCGLAGFDGIEFIADVLAGQI